MAKTAQLQIRVSQEEKERIRAAAAREGMDVSTYVLSRALPSERREFELALQSLGESVGETTSSFAALHDLLEKLDAAGFARAVDAAPAVYLDPFTANYVAAMVETAANRKGVAPPAWTPKIPPLPLPWFASDLRSLRLYLLCESPVAFRRRNLFVDSTLGDRI